MKHLRLLLLLVFALLFAQQGALAHGITHTLTEPQQSLPHEAPCELCAAYAQLGNAPLGAPSLPPTLIGQAPPDTATSLSCPTLPPLPASARSPPAFS